MVTVLLLMLLMLISSPSSLHTRLTVREFKHNLQTHLPLNSVYLYFLGNNKM